MKFGYKKYLRVSMIVVLFVCTTILTWLIIIPTNTNVQSNAKVLLILAVALIFGIYPIRKLLKEKKVEYFDGQWQLKNYRSKYVSELNKHNIKEIQFFRMDLPYPSLSHKLIKIKMTHGATISFHSKEIKDFDKLNSNLRKDFESLITKQEF